MKRILPFIALLLTTFLVQIAHAQHDVDFDTVSVRAVQLTESVYVLYGYGGNIGLSIGADGPLVVDDQFEQTADSLQSTVMELAGRPIELAINTHWHYDHSDGNKALGPEGVIMVAHENSRTRMQDLQVLSVSEYRQEPHPDDALPDVTFEQAITLHWNSDTIKIFHAPNAHTDGDAIVWFKNSNVFHMGDVFVTYGFPYIDHENGGNLDGIIAACRKVIALADDNTWFIPGHGKPARKSDVLDFVEMIETVRARVAKLVGEGMSLDEILAEKPVGQMAEEWMTDGAVRWSYDAITKAVQ